MSNQNGHVVLQTLQDLGEPATLKKIVSHIAETAGVKPSLVTDTVKETLEGGLNFGYIQKSKGKYFAANVDDSDLQDKSQRMRRRPASRRRKSSSRSPSRSTSRSNRRSTSRRRTRRSRS